MTVRDLLVDATLNYARLLVQAAQPREAYRVLTEVAPVSALDHPRVRDFTAALAAKIDHAFDDDAYLRRYGAYANGGEPDRPFSDTNLMHLFRARATVHFAKQAQPHTYLSVGGGEGSVSKAVMEACPDAKLDYSELFGVGGDVCKALEALFPGRVKAVGRFDLRDPDEDPKQFDQCYDLIECLEVVEHVVDDIDFLQNLQESLTDNGVLLLSTPNSEDWFEVGLLDGAWYHHLTAYTARSLAEKMLSVGLRPTIYYVDKCLYVVAKRGPHVGFIEDHPGEVTEFDSTKYYGQSVFFPGQIVDTALNARILVLDGVHLRDTP